MPLYVITYSVPAGAYPNRVRYTADIRAESRDAARETFCNQQYGYAEATYTGWVIESVEPLVA